MYNVWPGERRRKRARERWKKRNPVTTRPRIETNYACRSNLRRRKYVSNAFKVNCISLCRARIVCSSLRRVTMHNTRKSAHHAQQHKERRNERGRVIERERERGGRRGAGGMGEGWRMRRRVSLRAHENCMENKLHGQREHSCERITRAMAFAQYASVVYTQKTRIRLYARQIHRVN